MPQTHPQTTSTSSEPSSSTSQQTASSLSVEWVEPQYVEAFWGMLSPGLWKSVRKSRGNEKTVERIRGQLVGGNWGLWLVLGDGLEGFATTEVLTDDHGWWVSIPFAWSRGTADTHTAFFDHISPIMRERGARGIKFASYRPGYERVAKRRGWKKAMTQYIVEYFE